MQEWNDEFLSLFPHRFDYIYATYPESGQSPNWKTESRYPLSDRILQQRDGLFGVRFGKQTNYCLLDIDAGSAYHPQRDRFALSRILAALEPLGLVDSVVCTSSYSGGLHVYLPFADLQVSWELATVVSALLDSAGFRLVPGQLELFPNPRPYGTAGNFNLFNAHRLPMQIGSYLLNEDFQPIWSSQQTFVQHWRFAQRKNLIDRKTFQRLLRQARRSYYRVSGKAEKFLDDLNREIEPGWTGHGQTNYLLGRITLRAYVFHHILFGGEPRVGQALVDEVVATATSLPGYTEWCRHQHEIEQRAEEWARCVEGSRYFHYGSQAGKYKAREVGEAASELLTWNQRQAESARDRIRRAIATLLDQNALPVGATARFQALLGYGIGGGSLYRHRDLWHPKHLTEQDPDSALVTGLRQHNINHPVEDSRFTTGWVVENEQPVENPPYPPTSQWDGQLDCGSASNCPNPASLLPGLGGNVSSDKGLASLSNPQSASVGNNSASDRVIDRIANPQMNDERVTGSGWSSVISGLPTQPGQPNQSSSVQQPVVPISDLKRSRLAAQEAVRLAREQIKERNQRHREASQQSQAMRMQQFLQSDDPILMAEARTWFRQQMERSPL